MVTFTGPVIEKRKETLSGTSFFSAQKPDYLFIARLNSLELFTVASIIGPLTFCNEKIEVQI